MGALSRAMTLALSVGLVGCTLKAVPSVTEAPAMSSAVLTAPVSAADPLTAPSEEAAAPEAGYGWLNLTIRWPEPAPGYAIALLPTTTQAVVVTVKTASGAAVGAPVIISRAAGATKVTKSIRVEAGSNLSVKVEAYREASPILGTSVPIAHNSGVVNVTRSKVSPLPLTLEPVYVPTVEGFNSNVGRVDGIVTIHGKNFGSGNVPTPVVTFNGVPSTSVIRSSDTLLMAAVPTGALTGNVVVKADGVPSTSQATFWVLSSFVIEAPRQSWDNGPINSRMVRYGNALQFTGRQTWATEDGKTPEQYGTPPTFTWVLSDPAAGTLTEGGRFLAATSFATSSVKAVCDTTNSNVLEVRAVGVDSVTLDRTDLTLNALDAGGGADAGYVTSATIAATVHTTAPVDGGVTWSSSDESRVTVANGVVRTVADAQEGKVTITATAVDDPSKKATASVTVTIMGDLELEIE